MDEARRVLERLERIEKLRGRGAAAAELLPELRELVREGGRWTAAERGGAGAARAALDLLDARLTGGEPGSGDARGKEVTTGSCG